MPLPPDTQLLTLLGWRAISETKSTKAVCLARVDPRTLRVSFANTLIRSRKWDGPLLNIRGPSIDLTATSCQLLLRSVVRQDHSFGGFEPSTVLDMISDLKPGLPSVRVPVAGTYRPALAAPEDNMCGLLPTEWSCLVALYIKHGQHVVSAQHDPDAVYFDRKMSQESVKHIKKLLGASKIKQSASGDYLFHYPRLGTWCRKECWTSRWRKRVPSMFFSSQPLVIETLISTMISPPTKKSTSTPPIIEQIPAKVADDLQALLHLTGRIGDINSHSSREHDNFSVSIRKSVHVQHNGKWEIKLRQPQSPLRVYGAIAGHDGIIIQQNRRVTVVGGWPVGEMPEFRASDL